MTHYKIIQDEQLLKDFIDWLPVLTPSETYYLCLFARSKYCKDITHIKSDKIQMKRFTADKDWLVTKIRQLETPVGSYRQRDIEIPQEALALYITPNPRCLQKATKQGLIKLANLITQPYNGYNPHAEIMSEIQKAQSYTAWVDFDYDDCRWTDIKDFVASNINLDAVKVLNTRGGVHLLVSPQLVQEQYKKHWYNKLRSHDKCDLGKHGMIPVVGCTQGGYVPYFERLE